MTVTDTPGDPTVAAEPDEPQDGPDRLDLRDTPALGRPGLTFVLGLFCLPLWSLICTAVLETPMWSGEVSLPLASVAVLSKPLDVLVVLVVMVLLWGVTGRLWLSAGLLLGLTAAISAVNVAKMSILAEPLVPNDYQFLRSTDFLLEMVQPRSLVAAAAGMVVLAAGTTCASRAAGRRHPRVRRGTHPRAWRAVLALRVVALAVCLPLLSSTLSFNEPGNGWRRLYDANGALWQPFSQEKNYRTNGVVGGLLYNMPSDPMEEPDGYSAATMREIAARYADRAARTNATRSPDALSDVNVVLVLSEAFGDLGKLRGLEVSTDTIPETRRTIAESWGGQALANAYGTGTSGMEFEALTGQTLGLFKPQVTAPYQNFMTDLATYPSAVGWLDSTGHVPVAVHPYQRDFYRRDVIYPALGFRDFEDETSFASGDRLERSDYISDAAAFDRVEDRIAASPDPLLVNLVTMQNHVPTDGWYDDPVSVTTPGGQGYVDSLGGYARGQQYTDRALADFLTDLRASPEPTVVVFYGDHYPAVLPDEVLDATPSLDIATTPMFIWSNRDQGQEPRALPVTSPTTFLPYVVDLLGAPRPPYYQLLSDVAEKIGAVAPGRIVSPDGRELEESDLDAEQRRLLDDYRLVQYDFSIGQRYAVDEMWYPFG